MNEPNPVVEPVAEKEVKQEQNIQEGVLCLLAAAGRLLSLLGASTTSTTLAGVGAGAGVVVGSATALSLRGGTVSGWFGGTVALGRLFILDEGGLVVSGPRHREYSRSNGGC